MTKKDLMRRLEYVDDDTPIFLEKHDMPGWRELHDIILAPHDLGMCGVYITTKLEDQVGVFLR